MADTGTSDPFFAFVSALSRMSGGYSGLLPIAEDSAGLATPSTFSGVGTGQEPPAAGTNGLPPESRLLIRLKCLQALYRLARPRAPSWGFHGVLGTGAPDTARLTHGDSITSVQRNRIAYPPSRG